MQYSKWGYTFGAEQMKDGSWAVIGHKKGKLSYAMTKLGTDPTEEGMLRKLVSWAKHVLAVPVRREQVGGGSQQPVEMELFSRRVGCVV